MPDEHERIEQLAAEGRISQEDAVQFQEALAAAEERGAARGGMVLSWTLLAVDVALLLGLAAALPFSGLHTFEKMFMDMELKEGLPFLTELLLYLPGWGYALLFLGLAAVMVTKELLVKRKAVTLAVNTVVLVGLLMFKMFVVWALFLPMVSMMQQLSETT